MVAHTDYILAALSYRDSSDDAGIRNLTDSEVIKAVEKRIMGTPRPKSKSPINYADPTGDLAVGLASAKSKRRSALCSEARTKTLGSHY